MKKNMGKVDRIMRVIIAIVFGILYFQGILSGTLGLILMVLSVVFLATSFISFCPIYAIFGLNTCGIKK